MTALYARRALRADGSVGPLRLIVQGARIITVEPDVEPQPGDDDVGRRLLTPAFVDLHTHLALVALRGLDVATASAGNVVEDLFFTVERQMTADDVRAFARVGAYEALLHGTAMVSDHYYFGGAVAEALVDAGLSGIVAPTLQDLSGPGVTLAEQSWADTAAIRDDRRLADAGVFAALGPHATDTVSDPLWQQIAEAADRWQLPVHTHLAQSPDEVARAFRRHGTTPLGLLHRLGVLDAGPAWALVHALFVGDDELAALDPARHLLVACPSSQAWFGFLSPVAAWRRAGVPWVVATDCTATNDSLDLPKELRALAARRTAAIADGEPFAAWADAPSPAAADLLWADRQRAWRAGDEDTPTSLLPRILQRPGAWHPQARAGALSPGHLAHLALWDLDHPSAWPADDVRRALCFGNLSPALSQLMVAGRWRTPRDAHASTLSTEPAWREACTEAHRRRISLLRRAGLSA